MSCLLHILSSRPFLHPLFILLHQLHCIRPYAINCLLPWWAKHCPLRTPPLIYGRLCTWLAFASNSKRAHCNLQLFQESRGRPFTAQVSQVFGLFSSDDLALCSSSVTPSHGHARPFSNYSSSQLSLSRMPLSNHYLLCSRSFSPMALTRQFLGENFTR